ncbi:GH39 family glycosyl hydrolase [Flavicella sediminum]|uniref:GH39 family glycosyl hydrolase n=1 Tax=Flavicella sediminum TaxID=2585141 RepID=UPI001122D72B|nr:hypothetical protein [Flavicella sediminum]
MFVINRKILFSVAFCITSALFFSCSSDPVEEEIVVTPKPEEPEPEGPVTVDPDKVVAINTGAVVGELYNFWSTRPMINQTRFTGTGFTSSLVGIKPYVKSYNLVRVLGGRTDDKNNFYKGVDASGKIITDFSDLLTSMRAFMKTGFKPRIVLDNVPWDMSGDRVVDTYGNSKPPINYDLWRQYINAFLQTLITEFGQNTVKTWRFRVATEPNYTPHHWRGTRDEYFKHYDITVDEVLKVIPDAIIGPGNLLTEGAATWTTDIIDHCATGTNYATGTKGTKMSFFCLSYYEKLDQKTIKLEEKIAPYRAKLNSYPQFKDIPFDIQEFGILKGDNGKRGLSLSDATEVGASWYATIAEMAYQYRISEIYDWGQESTDGLATGRRNVTEMFLKMEGGNRLVAEHNFSGFTGVIPVVKNGRIYILAYNHNTTRSSTASKVMYPVIEGGEVSSTSTWKMNEWTIDKTHGVFMNELYKDVRAAGVANKTTSSARIYGNRPDDYFEDGWNSVFDANKTKYENLAKLPKTIDGTLIEVRDTKITLKVELEPHSVKLIELIPQ